MAMSQTMDRMDNKLVTPAEVQWAPGPAVLPAGIQGAVLYGDPTKEGLFSMRSSCRRATASRRTRFQRLGSIWDLPYRDG
jgi:hypothetical protein